MADGSCRDASSRAPALEERASVTTATESVDEFRRRARAWLEAPMPRQGAPRSFTGMLARMFSSDDRARALQGRLPGRGLAGSPLPTDSGDEPLAVARRRA